MLRQVYLDCQATAPSQKVILMGDSAGGNLALALAELLKQEQLPTPSSVVLLSPELDCTLSNPKIKSLQHLDPELSASDLLRCNKIYRGELLLTDWRVSPIFGDYSGIGPISIFTGTSDILNPDARQMAETSNQLQIPLHYYEYPNQIHDFMLLDLPESQIAKSQILATLSEALN
jgi:acetyl esterase/lipase